MDGTGRADRRHCPRPDLVAAILASDRPVRVVEAPAGSGKTALLREIGAALGVPVSGRPPRRLARVHLWDVAPGAPGAPGAPVPPLPDDAGAAGGCLILAHRPGTAIPGLARARIYGRVADWGWEALLLSPEALARGLSLPPEAARALAARTGGWACLLGAAASGAGLAAFLRAEVLAPLPGPRLVALAAHLDGRRLPDPGLLRGLPFADPARPDEVHPVLAAIRDPLCEALAEETAARMTDPPAVRAIALAQAALGEPGRAIAALQGIGAWAAALAALREAGGPFFVHRFGPEAFDRALAGFPPALAQEEDLLVLCRAIQAVKRGEVPLSRRILRDRWGEGMAEAGEVIRARALPLEVRFVRFLLCTWDDFDVGQGYLDAAWDLLAELPAENDLWRGSFYNAVLEFYIRARRFPEADDAAARAAAHYARAGIPILSFYIDLHRGIIALSRGDPRAATGFAQAARGHLDAAAYESPGDARLLALLDACVRFEAGDGAALARFLSLEVEALAQGEIWPSLIEMALSYGAQLLAEQYSTVAARAFLDRWRATGERSRQFQALIDLREAEVLQAANRWTEAAALAARVAARLPPEPPEPALLGTLADRDELGLALVRLRQAVREAPRRPGLEERLAALGGNHHLTARQRLAADLLLAEVRRRAGRPAEALAALQRGLGPVAESGAAALLRGERGLLEELMAVGRLREGLLRSEPLRRLLRTAGDGRPGPTARSRALGLTRQETRVLQLLCEGAPNKAMAKALGLSEATVKFHLANLYRKLGCRTRREAGAAAAALGLVA